LRNRKIKKHFFRSNQVLRSILIFYFKKKAFSILDLDSKTLKKVVKRLFRFIQANYQTFYSNAKKASAALHGSVISADVDLSPGAISALTGT
jgi:hypothetical protein